MIDTVELVELGATFTPRIARERWRLEGGTLVCDTPNAFVALGVTLESIDVALGTIGFTVEMSALDDQHVMLSPKPGDGASRRLASGLQRRAAGFRTPAPRIPALASGRLAAATATHGCRFAWIDAWSACLELGALLGATPPDGAGALGVIHAPNNTPAALIAAGRAATRVYLEADSLGLAAIALDATPLDDALLARRYDALVPSEPSDVAVVTSWFGHAP